MPFKLPTRSYGGNPVVLAFTVWNESNRYGGDVYDHAYVRVDVAERESVAAILAGTVGNAAGYGTTEAADRIGRECAALIRAGVTEVYNTVGIGTHVTMRWQRYDATSYCGLPRLHDVDGRARDIEATLELYEHVARLAGRAGAGGIADPVNLIAGLLRAKAVPLMTWPDRKRAFGEYSGSGGWIAADPATVYAALPIPVAA
jgi:hypothetical protein